MKENEVNSEEYELHFPNMSVYFKEAQKQGLQLKDFLDKKIYIDDEVIEELLKTWHPEPEDYQLDPKPLENLQKNIKKPTLLKTIGVLSIVWALMVIFMGLFSTNYIQLGVFCLIAMLLVVSGIGLIYLRPWAQQILRTIYWLTFIFYAGSCVAIPVFAIFKGFKGSIPPLSTWGFILLALLGTVAFSIPFLLMARYLGSNEAKFFLKPQNKGSTVTCPPRNETNL